MAPTSPSSNLKFGVFPLSEADRPIVAEHLMALDPAARRLRFGSALSDETLRELCARLPLQKGSWGLFIWGRLEGCALLVPCPRKAHRAEFAITLSAQSRQRGWGRILLRHVLEHAYFQGKQVIDIAYLRENTAMARLCREIPGPLQVDSQECLKEVDVQAWGHSVYRRFDPELESSAF